MPDRPRAADAGHLAHGGVIRVADPHADDQVGGVAQRPVVAEVGRRAGLSGGGPPDLQGGGRAEGRDARCVVAQDVGDQPGHALVQDAVGERLLLPGVEGRPGGVLHLRDQHRLDAVAAVGQPGIGGGQLQQAHLPAAERHGQVDARVVGQGGHAQAGQQAHQRVHADVIEGGHRRDVVGRGQRLPHAHRAVLHQGEVGRGVALQPPGDERRLHVEEHRRRRVGFGLRRVEGGGVGERLERAARLAGGQRGVVRAADPLVKVVRAAQHGQHVAGIGVEGHQRGIVDVVPLAGLVGRVEAGQVAAGDALGGLLPVQVEGGGDG